MCLREPLLCRGRRCLLLLLLWLSVLPLEPYQGSSPPSHVVESVPRVISYSHVVVVISASVLIFPVKPQYLQCRSDSFLTCFLLFSMKKPFQPLNRLLVFVLVFQVG